MSFACSSVMVLLLPQDQVHDPAAPHMHSWLAAVGQHVGVMATGFFEDIGQDRHPVKGTILVDALG
ncbi:MAG: hypothetical protein ACYC3I_23440 [Gemmataceae bacterium]